MASKIVDTSRRNDRIAAWLIKAGGLFVIVAVVGILLLIANVALPLFYSPSAEKMADVSADLQSLVALDGAGTTQTRELGENGAISVQLLPDNRIEVRRKAVEKDLLGNEKVSQQSYQLNDSLPVPSLHSGWGVRDRISMLPPPTAGWCAGTCPLKPRASGGVC